MAAKAYRKAATVEISARFVGNLQWVCPKCGNMHAGARQKIDWRFPTVTCNRCNARFDVGLWFRSPNAELSHVVGWYSNVPAGWTTNIAAQLPPGQVLAGRLVGPIWWICACKRLRRSTPDWQTGKIACPDCKEAHCVGLLLWKAKPGRRRRGRTPLDWILPVWDTEDAKELRNAASRT